jgi:transposase
MSRHDLSDEEWAVLEPVIPKKKSKRGRPRKDERQTLNGILYVLKTGCAGKTCRLSTAQARPAGDG